MHESALGQYGSHALEHVRVHTLHVISRWCRGVDGFCRFMGHNGHGVSPICSRRKFRRKIQIPKSRTQDSGLRTQLAHSRVSDLQRLIGNQLLLAVCPVCVQWFLVAVLNSGFCAASACGFVLRAASTRGFFVRFLHCAELPRAHSRW